MWYTYRRRGRRSCCRTRHTGDHRLRDTRRHSSRTFHASRTHYHSNRTTLPRNGTKWLQVMVTQCNYLSLWHHGLLPPANEVWSKVICLQACVCPRGGVAWSWGGWVHGPGGVHGGDPPTATAAGGTHPTRMHSCLFMKFRMTKTWMKFNQVFWQKMFSQIFGELAKCYQNIHMNNLMYQNG